MLDIKQKIEEINKKPEHIRVRFMYGAVFICMVFVIIIWFMSVKINFSSKQQKIQESTSIDDLLKEKVKNVNITE